jgi:hypothetical protein
MNGKYRKASGHPLHQSGMKTVTPQGAAGFSRSFPGFWNLFAIGECHKE